MPRLALLLEYVGTNLHGSQYQVGVRTVQNDLESALSAYLRRPTTSIFSGRTDAGVHSAGQVVHFDYDTGLEDDSSANSSIDLWRLCWALNGILQKDVAVRAVQIVPDNFHARFSAVSREYVYRILNRSQRSSLLKDNHYFVPQVLNLKAMQDATLHLVGSHDFASFKSSNMDETSTICRIDRAELLNKGEGRLEFWIAANHFVYNMVRIITGTLIEIGLGKRAPDSIAIALSQSNRNLTGNTAPSVGLTLNSVKYPEQYKLFEETLLS